MKIYHNLLEEIISNKNSWLELKSELSKYNIQSSESSVKDSRAGKIFEVFAKYYFLIAPTERGNFKNVWLFDEIPLEIKEKLNIVGQDYGVDLILEDLDGKFFAVQCKFRNDESSKLNWSSDKIANLFAFCPKADGYIVFTNASDIDSISKTRYENFTLYSNVNLLELSPTSLQNIAKAILGLEIKTIEHFLPKRHQIEAIQNCANFFEIEDRGQLILPCGAGKTLTALWLKEKLGCQNTLVLVPSLALLRQIKNDWKSQRKTNYRYLCVCSESDIDDSSDTTITHTYEIGINVTTQSDVIKHFLFSNSSEKVIFSTYHSLPAIEKAINGSEFVFDFIFCDEAHKTAGIGMNKFSLVHDNNKIPSKRRLYATATPRIVKESMKKKLGDDLKYAYDMNDPKVFGEEFYRMSFKQAIDEGILVDYKIIAVGVNSKEVKDFISKRRYVTSNITIDEVADNYALEHIMLKYDAKHALTFHSRVKSAYEFSQRHKHLFNNVESFSVNGEQPTSYRNSILNSFKNSSKAIISNARCLTEGVDVPIIDLVYFCDPRNSKVDIVQAVGRALRKKQNKDLGLVVVPIYHTNRDNVENSISESSFRNLLQVIRSLCEQDERLQDEINSIAFGKGSRSSSKIDILSVNFKQGQDKILLDGFEEKLKASIFDQIIDKTSNNWDLLFLELKDYLEKNKNVYPTEYDNIELYRWVAAQRTKKKSGILANEEIRKLNEIGFIWDMQVWKWNQMYSELVEYAKINDFMPSKENNVGLSQWYTSQLSLIKSKKLSEERIKKIQLIKFKGSAHKIKWIPIFEQLVKFREQNPDKWPQYDRREPSSDESKLNVFCQTIRAKYNKSDLEEYWLDKFISIDFNFDGNHNSNWLNIYQELKEYLIKRSRIDTKFKNYQWFIKYQKEYELDLMSIEKKIYWQELNLSFTENRWDDIFAKVNDWVEKNGKIPTKNAHKDFNSWLYSQRSVFKNGNLDEEQITKLKSIGFDLEGLGKEKNEEKWLEKFEEYKKFKEQNGREPGPTNENQLYIWVQTQRALKAGSMRNRVGISKEREDLLNSIRFEWVRSILTIKTWEENFNEYLNSIDELGLIKIPTKVNGVNNPIYSWLINQRKAIVEGRLDKEKEEKLRSSTIYFEDFLNGDSKDGFTKWADNLQKIKIFWNTNSRPPQSSNDKTEKNLYNALNRTKLAHQRGELSERQILFLQNIGLDFK